MELHVRNIIFWFTLIFVLSWGDAVMGQGNKNPFDINSGQQEEAGVTKNKSDNPFDISQRKEKEQDVSVAPVKPIKKDVEVVATESGEFKNFLFFLMFFVFIIFSAVAIMSKDLLKKVFNAFSNERLLNLLHQEKTIIKWSLLVLFLFFYGLNAGVFVFLTIKNLVGINDGQYFSVLMTSIFAVLFPFLVKYILLKTIGQIFSVQKEVNSYLFTIYIFFIVIGVVLFPINVFIGYSAESLKIFLIYFTFFGLTLVLIFRLIRGLFIGMRFLSFHIFHFLLYLCAVEIVPSLILVKIVLKYFG